MRSILKPTYHQTDVEIVSRQTVFQGFFKLEKLRLKQKQFDGGWSGEFSREVFVRGDAVGVLLFDPRTDQLLLVEQFRPGALYDQSQSPWQFEMVAGMTEAGESLESVVQREAQEEAGCTIEALEHLFKYWVSPGGTDEQIDLFLGIIDSTQVTEGVYGLDHEQEDIRVQLVSYTEAIAALSEGAINNAMAIIALQWLQLNRGRLQQKFKPT
ncbi:ADP-ribose pyrophosphatase [Oceanospirillum multiglobuliferum]|uniref:NUDIX domain-containing protein n=1 Tax=Oceanospirillum multiglobuliferum TaxID=64969 RepID=UPI0009CA6162|nr:NUDIX domain-containing protein [Oceanospirillum multiglobuliferum]SJZ63431.1 ADP-ribose pyrophosphatase [Oceanospirillum multiglobuliferum]